MLLSRLFISVSGVIIVIGIADNHKNLMEKQLLAEHLNISKVYYASLQAKVESARKINHDLKHILSAIRHYISTDDKSGLNEFCDLTEKEQLAHSGIIYHYANRAKEIGAQFEYSGRIPDKSLSDMDFCVLLGNALDNAVTGCLTTDGNHHITVISEPDGDVLSLMIRNSFDGKVNTSYDIILSRKRDRRSGVGLESMRSICEKYNGSMKTEWDENTFTVLFVLSLS